MNSPTDPLRQSAEADHARASEAEREASDTGAELPLIWLLGKTGAGKTSLLRSLTGLDDLAIGNGFEPCTRSARRLAFPPDHPLMRFLDSRGLGEAGYEAAEDLAACGQGSQLVLGVARLDDPAQDELAEALRQLRELKPALPVLLVFSGADLVTDREARFRVREQLRALLEEAAGRSLPWAEVALPPPGSGRAESGVEQLIDLLDAHMPAVALLLADEERGGGESRRFAELRAEVLRYASTAGATDVAPILGAVGVPSVQAAMLRMLGKRHGVNWSRERLLEFLAALGLGTALRYAGSHAARQAGKLVPGLGQTLGAAAAGSLSFATTFALGRAASYYLYHVGRKRVVPPAELRGLYKEALIRARHART